MIAFAQVSFGQSKADSVCFTLEQAREINERVTLYPILLDEIENYIKKEGILERRILILEPQLSASQAEVQRLTSALNDSEAKQQQLKRKRVWWGVGGLLVGALTYSILQ